MRNIVHALAFLAATAALAAPVAPTGNAAAVTDDRTNDVPQRTEGVVRELVVKEAGVAVSISKDGGLIHRYYGEDEMIEMIRLVTPASQGAGAQMKATAGSMDASLLMLLDRINRLAASLTPPLDTPTPSPVAQPVREPERRARTPSGDSGGTPDPIVGPRVELASGSGADWSWDIWSRDTTTFDTGEPVTRTAYGVSSSGNEISAADFQTIADGATLYNLSGSGAAGALITQGDLGAAVSGSADIRVRTGAGITPSWSGDFNMGGGGNSLNFNADGNIEGGRLVKGAVNSYSLNAFGSGYGQGSLSREDVGGALVGSGQGPNPISGAIVDFDFEHGGGGPRARGSGGADF
jgi:hypothetical protein